MAMQEERLREALCRNCGKPIRVCFEGEDCAFERWNHLHNGSHYCGEGWEGPIAQPPVEQALSAAPAESLLPAGQALRDFAATLDNEKADALLDAWDKAEYAYLRAAAPAPSPLTEEQVVWFHGTSRENAEIIKRDGFKAGTWFARHMEDAVEFGGPYVFWVKVKFSAVPSANWQVCCENALPPMTIQQTVLAASPAEQPPGWIKCSDKMPPHASIVFVWDSAWNCSYVAQLTEEGWDPAYEREAPIEITHWMPFPASPAA